MGHVEGGMDWTAVGVLAAVLEEFILVEIPVLVIYGVIKGDGDHLGDITGQQTTWHECAIRRAEAVGQGTLERRQHTYESCRPYRNIPKHDFYIGIVAYRRCVWVMLGVAPSLVAVVIAVCVSIAEQCCW